MKNLKLSQTLSIRIMRKKEAFLLHYILGFLKESWDECGIKAIFTYTDSLNRTIKKVWKWIKFFLSAIFFLKNSQWQCVMK